MSTYKEVNHRSTGISLTGNQCPHIARATTASTDISLNVNQCPHIKWAATASTTMCPTGVSVHIEQGQPQHQLISVLEEIMVHIKLEHSQPQQLSVPLEISEHI